MKAPDYLKVGDVVALVAPARLVKPREMEPAINVLKSWGLEVVEGRQLYASYHQFAGKDIYRVEDLQRALDEQQVKAIFCARGGYGLLRIIDSLCCDGLRKYPKWIVGFSDITVLHGHIQRQVQIQSLHAPMPINFYLDPLDGESLESLRGALFGEPLSYCWETNALDRKGQVSGLLAGGNLSILHAINGSASAFDPEDKILFIEDLDEYLYHLDRMMLALKRSGYLSRLKALLVGGMTRMRDNDVPFGKNAYEIIAEAVEDFDYPVAFGFPAGHQTQHLSLPLGSMARLEMNDTNCLTIIR